MERTTDGRNYKWVALALLWVAFFLQQGTRQLFGPSIPAICGSLGVDKVAIGVVGTVFAMMYGVCVPFAGVTADLFSRKWMVTAGVAVFCLGIFLSGFVAAACGDFDWCMTSFHYYGEEALRVYGTTFNHHAAPNGAVYHLTERRPIGVVVAHLAWIQGTNGRYLE